MAEIKLYKSMGRGFKLIAMCLPFVLIGYWIISKEQPGTFDYIMGWLCASFFGMGILIGFISIFDKRPQIIINETGIWDRTLKQDEIKWEEIIEAYPIEISRQKFISIVLTDTFEFKKKQYKWVGKFNEFVGAQKLNLNLSQIKIDENKLALLINKLIAIEKNERNSLIKAFPTKENLIPSFNFQKYILYFFAILLLAILSLSNFYAFWIIMIVMGISAVIAKWFSGTQNNSKLRKYSEKMTYLGLINMVLILLIFKIYDYSADKIEIKLNTEIENYKIKYGVYPNSLKTISDGLEFNFVQKYIVNDIDYTTDGKEYTLELPFLNDNP